MFFKLLLLFTVGPLIELALLIKIGQIIHLGPTLALVILTGIVGAALARQQGFAVLNRISESLARGAIPTNELIDALLVLVAGALLITPGIITDAVGLLALFPPSRALIRKRLIRHFKDKMEVTIRRGNGTYSYEAKYEAEYKYGHSPKQDFIDVEASEPPDTEQQRRED